MAQIRKGQWEFRNPVPELQTRWLVPAALVKFVHFPPELVWPDAHGQSAPLARPFAFT
jgi:hypothetical protein